VLDQTALPRRERWVEVEDIPAMVETIASLRVRGAPAIGIAAALALAVEAAKSAERGEVRSNALRCAGDALISARPTATNLAWAVRRVLAAADRAGGQCDAAVWGGAVRREALAIWEEDRAASTAMARAGASLFETETRFMTHCNTGGLATGGGGTALAVILELQRSGRPVSVWATETRPLLQGARLTAWELSRAAVPVRLVTEGAAASVMARRRIEAVLVGADRIARNGDVANKVGTFSLALAAKDRGIPFVVVAPTSTLDPACSSGEAIPIEERHASEVLELQGVPIAPEGVGAENPAFDVTPARLVTAIVTERGVNRGPVYEFGAD
jgi:methylthioribose-1-phosphate isomerase